jgi:hypothetical protein
MMYWIEAEVLNIDTDYRDTLMIGLFSTPEKAIEAARNWIKKEREDGSEDDICLCGWRAEPDSDKIERLDLIHTPWNPDEEANNIIFAFRKMEKEFPIVKEEDE